MPLIEAIVIQDDESVVKLIITPHSMHQVIASCSTQNFSNDLITMKLPKNLQITLKNCSPFRIACLHTSDISVFNVLQFVEDIEDRITVLLAKYKSLNGEAREILHDYMEKLVNYYQDQAKLGPDNTANPDMEFEVIVLTHEELERLCNSKLELTKRFGRNSSTRSLNTRRRDQGYLGSTLGLGFKNSPTIKKKLCVFFSFLVIMGLILMIYLCGGYEFDTCKI